MLIWENKSISKVKIMGYLGILDVLTIKRTFHKAIKENANDFKRETKNFLHLLKLICHFYGPFLLMAHRGKSLTLLFSNGIANPRVSLYQ